MKRSNVIILSLVLFLVSSFAFGQCGDELVDNCASDIGDATYLKDFRVKLEKAEKNKPAPVQRISVVLNKGTTYKFSVCDAPEYDGKAIIQLYDTSRLLGSSLNMSTGKLFSEFKLDCSKTGVYYIFISFQDGNEGCAAAILSYVEQ
ncbi:MAG: hypothetical protein IPO21_08530 [Bacteroidales bacterium]|nr:hypothetical protein [Bacteroidales bacterium]